MDMMLITTLLIVSVFSFAVCNDYCERLCPRSIDPQECMEECWFTNNPPSDDDWERFKAIHGREFSSSDEEEMRRGIFEKNAVLALLQAEKFINNESSYYMYIDKMTDKTIDDLPCLIKRPSYERPLEIFNSSALSGEQKNRAESSDPIDWRKKGAVTPVKNQGNCGSCYAFGSTGCVEGANFVKNNKLISLSEQYIMDCVYGYGGCDGGWHPDVLRYIKNHGITSEELYPYKGESEKVCKKTEIVVNLNSIQQVKAEEGEIEKALKAYGPLVVGVAVSDQFQHHRGGIFHDENCSDMDINHSVTIVGNGNENGQDYWIVKNSWGPNWSEKGYIRMLRGKNLCKINDVVTLAEAK